MEDENKEGIDARPEERVSTDEPPKSQLEVGETMPAVENLIDEGKANPTPTPPIVAEIEKQVSEGKSFAGKPRHDLYVDEKDGNKAPQTAEENKKSEGQKEIPILPMPVKATPETGMESQIRETQKYEEKMKAEIQGILKSRVGQALLIQMQKITLFTRPHEKVAVTWARDVQALDFKGPVIEVQREQFYALKEFCWNHNMLIRFEYIDSHPLIHIRWLLMDVLPKMFMEVEVPEPQGAQGSGAAPTAEEPSESLQL